MPDDNPIAIPEPQPTPDPSTTPEPSTPTAPDPEPAPAPDINEQDPDSDDSEDITESEDQPTEDATEQLTEEQAAQKQAWEDEKQFVTATLDTKMEHLKSVLDALHTKFKTSPNYTIYIRFQLNSVVFCTTDKTSENNLIMSLQVENNGSGYANSFRLQVAWTPSVVGSRWDVNKLEMGLLGGNFNGLNFSSRYCTLQYGYGDGNDLRTKQFDGIILDYTCDLQDGMIIYDLEGYSSIVAINETKDPIAIAKTEDEETSGVRPTTAVYRIVKTYLQAGDSEDYTTYTEEDSIELEKHPISPDVSYDIKFLNDCYASDAPVALTTQLDKNISQAISDILGKAVLEEEYTEIADNYVNLSNLNKTYYNWFLDDTADDAGHQGTIYVYKTSVKEDIQSTVDIVFNWMSPGQSGYDWLIKSFKPQFKGSVLLATASELFNPKQTQKTAESEDEPAEDTATSTSTTTADTTTEGATEAEVPDEPTLAETKEIFNGSYYLDNTGKIAKTERSISPPIGGTKEAAISSIEQEKSSWLQDVQYSYAATMVTLGVPAPIPITGKIRVTPLIYGSAHHSEGIYMVKSTTDLLNSNGFETTWELQKIVDIEAANSFYDEETGQRIWGYTENGTPKTDPVHADWWFDEQAGIPRNGIYSDPADNILNSDVMEGSSTDTTDVVNNNPIFTPIQELEDAMHEETQDEIQEDLLGRPNRAPIARE